MASDVQCQRIDSKSLPSVLCFTVLNSHGHLTAATVSDDAAMVASGYSDSTLRVWRTDGTAFDSAMALPPGVEAERAGEDCALLVGHSGQSVRAKG